MLLLVILNALNPKFAPIVPVFVATSLIFLLAGTFLIQDYYNLNIYRAMVGVVLAVMLIFSYLNAPAENRLTFYIIITIFALTIFYSSRDLLIRPKIPLEPRKKVSLWFTSILLAASFIVYFALFLLDGNYAIILVTLAITAVAVLIGLFISKRKIVEITE